MFIDFVTLMLLNMSAGFGILAAYLVWGWEDNDQKRWGLGFGTVGLIALIFGVTMTTTWPIIGQYSSAYGEMTTLLGVIFLGAGIGLLTGLNLKVVAGYALPVGLAAILLGIRFAQLHLANKSLLAVTGFVLSGLAGVFAWPTLMWLGAHKPWRWFAALVLLGTALLWLFVAFEGYWGHMTTFAAWRPLTIR